MRGLSFATLVTLGLAAGIATAQNAQNAQEAPAGVSPPSSGTVISTHPMDTQAMQRLRDSADNLRHSIQALAQQPPGPQRAQALDKANEALLETQQAMLALPPHLRSWGEVSTADYDKSVRQLSASAASLRQAIQQMAQQPPGERRNQAIRTANRALWDTQMAMASAYQPAGAGTQSMGAADASAHEAQPTALVLLPTQQASSPHLAQGCWVRFFDQKGFRGDTLTLAGPADMADMDLPGHVWRDWSSAVVGPHASVTTYDNENFRDRTATLHAGQSVADLHDNKLGWMEDVKSAKVSCV